MIVCSANDNLDCLASVRILGARNNHSLTIDNNSKIMAWSNTLRDNDTVTLLCRILVWYNSRAITTSKVGARTPMGPHSPH